MRMLIAALASAMALAACDPAPVAETESTAESASVPPIEPVEEPVAAERAWPAEFYDTDDSPLTNEEIVGMWSTVPNCAQPTVFSADGTFTDHTGRSGRWALNGDHLTMGGRSTNEANQFDANTFSLGAPADRVAPGAMRTFLIYRRC